MALHVYCISRQVTALFQGYISTLLAQYSASPANAWKAKDVAIYLVIALTIKGGTSRLGATQVRHMRVAAHAGLGEGH